jgi:putative ABC transport system substrate-binding protein
MRELGYIEGNNISFEVRVMGDKSPSELAAELVGLKVTLIVAHQTPAAQAVKAATGEIPIVAFSGDPVATGLVESLSHPDGNVTGVSGMNAELSAKCVELLREALPSARKLAVLANATDPFSRPFLDHVLPAAKANRFEARQFDIASPQDLNVAFLELSERPVETMIVQPSLPRRRAFDVGRVQRIATTTPFRAAQEGALITYNADAADLYRVAARVTDQLLKGAHPSSLPVALPVKFHLAINLETARALNVTIPPTLLARADEVIE